MNGFQGKESMPRGALNWFKTTKDHGSIQPEGGGKDAFARNFPGERAGLRSLNKGQNVSYELNVERGKSAAVNSRPPSLEILAVR